jgi:putative Holliday junction resolvase
LTEDVRVLGVDYGTTRIGLSVSDPLGILARPLETLANNEGTWTKLRELVTEKGIRLVVVGMPYNLKGEKGQQAKAVELFVGRLKRELSVEVVVWDERFTSTIAQRTLLSMGTTRKQRRTDKGRVDAMAAAVMLQSFLDSTKRSLSC